MDEVGNQQRQIDAAVSTAFGTWGSQLRVQLEEMHVMKVALEKKTEDLGQLQQSIATLDAVRQENEQLRQLLKASQGQNTTSPTPWKYDELERERDALLHDNQLKQKTIDSLRSMLNYENTKSRDWWRHSNSSPSPSLAARRSRAHHQDEAGPVRETASIADGIPVLSNEASVQKLALPLKDAEAHKTTRAIVAENLEEHQASTGSDKDSTVEDTLSPPLASNETGSRDGPVSIPDLHTVYSPGDNPSELPRRPQSSLGVRRSEGSALQHANSDQSHMTHLQFD